MRLRSTNTPARPSLFVTLRARIASFRPAGPGSVVRAIPDENAKPGVAGADSLVFNLRLMAWEAIHNRRWRLSLACTASPHCVTPWTLTAEDLGSPSRTIHRAGPFATVEGALNCGRQKWTLMDDAMAMRGQQKTGLSAALDRDAVFGGNGGWLTILAEGGYAARNGNGRWRGASGGDCERALLRAIVPSSALP